MTADQPPDASPTTPPPANRAAPTPRARTRTMIGIAIGIVALFLILLAVGVVPRVRNNRALAASAENVRTAVTAVYVVRPQLPPDTGLKLAATTQAIQDSVIYARTSGYLTKRHVDIGDRVQAGQLLAEIESPEIVQQLRQARAELLQAERTLDLQKASRDLAQVTMGRYQAADAERAVAIEAVDQSVSTFRTAEAAVAAAEASVESNRANVQRLVELNSFQRVVAPFSGTIIQRNVDVGALITAGSPTNNTAVAPSNLSGSANGLFEVARVDTLRVFVNVPQAFASNVRAGLPAKVSVRGHLDAPVAATVTRTASALDPGTRTLLTQVDIPNPSGQLLPGMFVYVELQLAPNGVRSRVPATAVIVDAQGNRVAIVAAGNAIRFQRVQLGRDFGDSFEVQGGLHGDEMIVAQPTVSLKEGQVVKPMSRSAGL
jgi:membrane fusion protein (multidrug efflux system)